MKIIKKLPLSLIAIFLALLTCGNLLRSYSESLRLCLGLGACFLLGLFILKLVLDWDQVKKDLESPLTASVIPALSMGLMVLASYLKDFNYNLGLGLYLGALVLHLVLVLIFSRSFLRDFKISQVYPTWFIVYVGIATGGIIAPYFKMEALGRLLFYFGAISYLVLMPINIYRFSQLKDLDQASWPSIGVFCSPASLGLASYVSSFTEKNMSIFFLLLVLSQGAYFFVVSRLPRLLESNFYPSLASFSFPMAVSALALKISQDFLLGLGYRLKFLNYLVKLEEALAIFIIAYVGIRYGSFVLARQDRLEKNLGLGQDLDIDMD